MRGRWLALPLGGLLAVAGVLVTQQARADAVGPGPLVNVRASAGFDVVRVRVGAQTPTDAPSAWTFRLYRGVDGGLPTLLREFDYGGPGPSPYQPDVAGYDDTAVTRGHSYSYELAGVSDSGLEGARVSLGQVALTNEEFLLGASNGLWSGSAAGPGGFAKAADGPYLLATYSPDGRTYASGGRVGQVAADPATTRVLGTIDYRMPDGSTERLGAVNSGRSVISHDGRWIVAQVVPVDGLPSDFSMLARFPLTATGSPIAGSVLPGSQGLSEPLFTADGTQVLGRQAAVEGSPLYRLSAGRQVAVPGTAGARLAVSSSDGRWIAYVVHPAGADSVARVVPASGGSARTVPVTGAVASVGFSTDARRLFIGTASNAQQADLVWRARADGAVIDSVPSQVLAESITSRVLDTQPPTATLTAPTAAVTLSPTASVTFRGSDAGPGALRSFDLRRRTISAGKVSAYDYPQVWRGLLAGPVVVPLSRGVTSCFGVRAFDGGGNRSAFGADRCTTQAVDDGAFGRSSGWSRVRSTALYGGSAVQTSRRAAALSVSSVRGRHVTLVASRCPTCGTVQVSIGSTRLGSVSMRGRAASRVLFTLTAPRSLAGTLRVVVTSSGARALIDGYAVTP